MQNEEPTNTSRSEAVNLDLTALQKAIRGNVISKTTRAAPNFVVQSERAFVRRGGRPAYVQQGREWGAPPPPPMQIGAPVPPLLSKAESDKIVHTEAPAVKAALASTNPSDRRRSFIK